MMGFGDSSVNLELRAWIDDPTKGVGNVKSDVLLEIWDRFRARGVAIPYPQRDVHVRSFAGPPQPPPDRGRGDTLGNGGEEGY